MKQVADRNVSKSDNVTTPPSGTGPPIHMPFFFEAAILSRIRSAVTSRSNWAKDKSMLSVSRPIEVEVLKAFGLGFREIAVPGKIPCSAYCVP